MLTNNKASFFIVHVHSALTNVNRTTFDFNYILVNSKICICNFHNVAPMWDLNKQHQASKHQCTLEKIQDVWCRNISVWIELNNPIMICAQYQVNQIDIDHLSRWATRLLMHFESQTSWDTNAKVIKHIKYIVWK